MYAVEKLSSYITRGVYTVSGPFHPFGGAVDIIVVQQPDGTTFKSSPWYVRFGKFQGVLKTKEKVVNISVNNSLHDPGFHMFLDHKGEAFFLKDTTTSNNEQDDDEEEFVLSPNSSGDDDADAGREIVARSNSKRSRIFGMMFGRRSMDEGSGTSMERAEMAADLLEVKWSTNLPPSGRKGMDDNDTLSPSVSVCGEKLREVHFESPQSGTPEEVTSSGSPELLESSTVMRDVSPKVPCETSELICEINSLHEKEYCRDHDLQILKVEDTPVIQEEEQATIAMSADSPANACSSDTLLIETDELSKQKETETEPIKCTGERAHTKEREFTELSSPNSSSSGKSEDSELISNNSFQPQEVEILGKQVIVELPNGIKGNLEEEQFLFSDTENFGAKETDPGVSPNDSGVETDNHMSITVEGDIDQHELESMDQEESFESITEVSDVQTSPMSIPRSKTQWEGTDVFSKSVPIIRSHIHDLERSNLLYPVSCSLELNTEKYEQDLPVKESSSLSKLEADSDVNMVRGNCRSVTAATAIDAEDEEEQKVTPFSSAVELSLCKHLLFEGMGSEAASLVFNTEKVKLVQFSHLGPSLIKNDKLVVRIGGRYFPWAAASPIILGMVSFGQEHISNPQGMIAVDRDEKNLDENFSKATVPSGGSWRLWPFGSKKSKSISIVQSVPESINIADADTSPMRSQSMIGHDDLRRAKFIKKKVRSLTPTSEQLASLNLKEGRNVVTFSFSTAMLGQQQVDARIYLWKWNTRIVISDVDGTITKSDVLGQFMPLVGKDWSQTGVTHLFSAIKENGYQLLFLSARAISQAYLTRQFLLNLKQDGKALPDGPVVISPDGLFPSLYREVIRRAPHEFKIACLEDIRALFPPECNPFYAGFGNRDTDEVSYLKVGIPKGKIFIINPKGEVAVNRRVDTKSYTSLHALVNGMFPPMSSAEPEDFNSWNYWKLPLIDVNI